MKILQTFRIIRQHNKVHWRYFSRFRFCICIKYTFLRWFVYSGFNAH